MKPLITILLGVIALLMRALCLDPLVGFKSRLLTVTTIPSAPVRFSPVFAGPSSGRSHP